MRVKKNPFYWEANEVHLNEVSFIMVSRDTEMQLFEAGKLDLAGGPLSALPIDAVEHLQKTGSITWKPCLGYSLYASEYSRENWGQIEHSFVS